MSFWKKLFGAAPSKPAEPPKEPPKPTQSVAPEQPHVAPTQPTMAYVTTDPVFDSLLRNDKIQTWHRQMTSQYQDPICVITLFPSPNELGSFWESLSFYRENERGELVQKAGTIAPGTGIKLDDGQWVSCLCGGFSKGEFSEVTGPKNKYPCYIFGKDLTKARYIIRS